MLMDIAVQLDAVGTPTPAEQRFIEGRVRTKCHSKIGGSCFKYHRIQSLDGVLKYD